MTGTDGGTLAQYSLSAWQFLFILGVLIGRRHVLGRAWNIAAKPWFQMASAIVAVSLFWLKVAGMSPSLATLFRTRFRINTAPALLSLAGKVSVGPLRLVHLIAVAVVISRANQHHGRWNTRLVAAVRECGRNSLWVFGAGVVWSYFAKLILAGRSADPAVAVAVSALSCLLLWGIARITRVRKERRRAEHCSKSKTPDVSIASRS